MVSARLYLCLAPKTPLLSGWIQMLVFSVNAGFERAVVTAIASVSVVEQMLIL